MDSRLVGLQSRGLEAAEKRKISSPRWESKPRITPNTKMLCSYRIQLEDRHPYNVKLYKCLLWKEFHDTRVYPKVSGLAAGS
jgi:hypothetical protein